MHIERVEGLESTESKAVIIKTLQEIRGKDPEANAKLESMSKQEVHRKAQREFSNWQIPWVEFQPTERYW